MPRIEEKEKKVPSFVMMNKKWCFCFTCDERKAKKHGSFLIPVEGKKKNPEWKKYYKSGWDGTEYKLVGLQKPANGKIKNIRFETYC